MATPINDRDPQPRSEQGKLNVERNAKLSARRRAKRPLPATREEADQLFRPRAGSNERAVVTGPRLCRLAQLGLLEIRTAPGPRITNLEAHQAILDFYYPDQRPRLTRLVRAPYAQRLFCRSFPALRGVCYPLIIRSIGAVEELWSLHLDCVLIGVGHGHHEEFEQRADNGGSSVPRLIGPSRTA